VNYPHGPYGQGFPGQQPGYPPPQQQGYPPQQPGYPPHGGYQYQPVPPPAPSGVTGIIAAVLSGLGALANLGAGLFGLLAMIGLGALANEPSYANSSDGVGGAFVMLLFVVLLGIGAGLLLAAGTVTLLLRKMIGRWLIVGGCALTIVGSLISFGIAAAVTAPYGAYSGGNGFAILGLIFPIATLVLVLLPPTTAWINAKRNPIRPY